MEELDRSPHPTEVFKFCRAHGYGPNLPSVFESECRYWHARNPTEDLPNWLDVWAFAAVVTDQFHSYWWMLHYNFLGTDEQFPTSRLAISHYLSDLVTGKYTSDVPGVDELLDQLSVWVKRYRDDTTDEEHLPTPGGEAPPPRPIPKPKPAKPANPPLDWKRIANLAVYVWAAVAYFLPVPAAVKDIVTEILKAIVGMFGG